MTRKEQLVINACIAKVYGDVLHELADADVISIKRLRACQAEVVETSSWFVLRSYYTFVASIHKETRTGYDFLRLVHGYTATSAQHIAKFFYDYGIRGVGGSGIEMRWYSC